jgi:hypothetical protein
VPVLTAKKPDAVACGRAGNRAKTAHDFINKFDVRTTTVTLMTYCEASGPMRMQVCGFVSDTWWVLLTTFSDDSASARVREAAAFLRRLF